MVKVRLSDGGESTFEDGVTVIEVLKTLDKSILKKTVAAKVDGKIVDFSTRLKSVDSTLTISPITYEDKEGLDILRHSTAHIMAQAVRSIFKGIKLAIGPTIEHGFYYDFDCEQPFSPDDIEKIEKKMSEIIKGNHPFVREELKKDEAIRFFKEKGELYKEELIRDIPEDTVSIYSQSDFADLCRGPHLPSTGYVKAFKLLTIAGAYWRGDEKRKMLQRIYGTAFADKKTLEEYLKKLEEASRRDHRKLGKELDLFSINDEVGAGLILWHPNGAIVRRIIEDFWRAEHVRHDYSIIYTPHIGKLDMWKTSGHWEFYRENLYSPMDVEGTDYIVKPMNCPFHIQIYKSRLRSYRDLPVRYAELGTVYRYERSGVLHGLLRVRGFTQDDAHIYCAAKQIEAEIKNILKFTLYILRSFGFNEYDIYLSTMPQRRVGSLDNWERAESSLKGALEAEHLKYSIDPGEGVFYGPKIDIKIKDTLGRSWQCSTIQVDFNLPERFDITYRDEGGANARPIMIHRALMGSLERFFGCLIEHYGGAFPMWLSPVQAVILSITDKTSDYAESVFKKLMFKGIRAELDTRSETLNYKIREAQMRKIPYMIIVGDKEKEKSFLSLRSRDKGAAGGEVTVEEFIVMAEKENRPEGGDAL